MRVHVAKLAHSLANVDISQQLLSVISLVMAATEACVPVSSLNKV